MYRREQFLFAMIRSNTSTRKLAAVPPVKTHSDPARRGGVGGGCVLSDILHAGKSIEKREMNQDRREFDLELAESEEGGSDKCCAVAREHCC